MADYVADVTKVINKSPAWTPVAEVRLCELVKENWQLLFGEIKGCGIEKVSHRRRAKWQEIATIVSHEFTELRTADQCRKKFQNIKSRSINKVSGIRHPPTGGGSTPILTESESCIADHLQTHEVVTGIPGGFDTDAAEPATANSCVFSATEPGAGARGSPADLPTPESKITTPSIKNNAKTSKGKKQREAASEETSIQTLTVQNLQLDNERLQAEIKKIRLQTELIEEQKETLKAVKDLAIMAKSYVANKNLCDFNSGNPFIDIFLDADPK